MSVYKRVYPNFSSNIIAIKNTVTGCYLVAHISLLRLYINGDVLGRSSTKIKTSKGFISKCRTRGSAIRRCDELISRERKA